MTSVSPDKARNDLELLTEIAMTRQHSLERFEAAAQFIDSGK